MASEDVQWPSVAYLFHVNSSSSCTVSIIGQNWLIASYECIASSSDLDPFNWVVFAGPAGPSATSPDGLDNGTQIKLIKRFVIHPKADFAEGIRSNDVALIEVDEAFDFNPYVSNVCIADGPIANGLKCVTAGWTHSEEEDVSFTQYLEPVKTPLADFSQCNSADHYNGLLNDGAFMCIDNNDNTCKNSLGAPLMCADRDGVWRLFGLLRGEGACLGGSRTHPDLFVDMANAVIADWIRNTIGN